MHLFLYGITSFWQKGWDGQIEGDSCSQILSVTEFLILHIKRKNCSYNNCYISCHSLQSEYPTPDLQLNADKFANYVWGRNKPMEEQDLRQRVQDIERKVVERGTVIVLGFYSRKGLPLLLKVVDLKAWPEHHSELCRTGVKSVE